jgi:hypothetical protein
MRIIAFILLVAAGSYACSSASAPTKPQVLASLKIVSGGGQSGAAGSALPSAIVVQALDSSGKPMAGLGVAYGPSAGSLNPTSGMTDSTGKASAIWTLGPTAGPDTLLIAVTQSNLRTLPTEFDTAYATATP